MKKNNLKAVATLATVALATAGTIAHADTVDTPNVPTEPNTTETVLDEQAQIKKAETAVANTTEKVSQAEATVQQAEQTKNETAHSAVVAEQEAVVAEATVQQAESHVDQAQTETEQAKAELPTAQAEVEQAKAEATNTEKALNNVQSETASKSIELQNKVQSLPETVTHTETKTVVSTDASKEVDGYKEKYPKTPQEEVEYNGTATEKVQLTSEQTKEYQETGKITYKPNVAKINQYFIDYVKQLRELNGIDIPVGEYSKQAQEYANGRINELMSSTNRDEDGLPILSHKTNLGDERTLENLSADTWKTIADDKDPKVARVLSDKEFAYRIALGWFADYGNISSGGYGHREALLFGASDSQAVAVGTVEYEPFAGFKRTRYYVAQVGVDEQGKDVYEQNAQKASDYRLKNVKIAPVTNEMTFNGKKLKFLPKMTFDYIATITTTAPSPEKMKVQQELEAYLANSQERIAIASGNAKNAQAKLAEAEAKLNNAVTRYQQADKSLEEAKSEMANAIAVAKDKADAYNSAKQKASEAEAEYNKAVESLNTARAQKAKAIENLEKLTGKPVVPMPDVPSPEVPDNGNNDENPVEPSNPTVKPEIPILPTEPTTPSIPEVPNKPTTPSIPEVPNKPTTPVVTPLVDKKDEKPTVEEKNANRTVTVKVNFAGKEIEVAGVADKVSNPIATAIADSVMGVGSATAKAIEKSEKGSKESKVDWNTKGSKEVSSSTDNKDGAVELKSKKAEEVKKDSSKKVASAQNSNSAVGYVVAGLVVAGLGYLGVKKFKTTTSSNTDTDNTTN